MLISTRGKKIELFEVDDFINFLEKNNYNYNRKNAIEFFSKNKINTIRLSKLPFSKKEESKKIKNNPQKENKSKMQILLEKSDCPEKFLEYLQRTKLEIKAFKNPPQKFLKKVLYYVYLPNYKYYTLIIQRKDFNYFRDFKYEILDKLEGNYFILYYIKLSLLKKYFNYRTVLNIDGMCHFECFNKKIIDKLPEKPILKIDYMEELK